MAETESVALVLPWKLGVFLVLVGVKIRETEFGIEFEN